MRAERALFVLNAKDDVILCEKTKKKNVWHCSSETYQKSVRTNESNQRYEKLYNSNGRELRRALFSLKQIFQDDKDLVHEFVVAEGLTCLIKVGAEADQNYQNYILRGALVFEWNLIAEDKEN
ncbi:FH1/FH2 domain-containing protein 3 [Grus japonensis]|uniref:FH1/FH2 domain-containing protein 3 n=1 Tax=Grus japonensis TaxID=30415 RepID=A0ABC9WD42_GRUJA